MRKCLFILVVIIFIFSFILKNDEEEIRVRIIPNSDESCDLLIKEEVKNIVICYLENIYDDNYQQYINNINNSIEELERIIDDNFVDCSISFKKNTLYNKEYNDNVIKNEETLLLEIKLGNAEGSNWWGSIYPQYLEVSSDKEVMYESLLVNLINNIKGK